jgi:hypothetical protein
MDLMDNPKLTYAKIRLQDLLEEQYIKPDKDYLEITQNKENALHHFQPIFSRDHISKLTKDEFSSFLLLRNNHHWDSLHRVGKFMVEDMPLLREALLILLDETQPIKARINELRPERYWGTNSMVSHLGMPVLSAILLIEFPDKYGVWNNTSDAGMKAARLWESRWDKQDTGTTYCEMNEIYLNISSVLNIDLWTLDVLWWVLKKRSLNK